MPDATTSSVSSGFFHSVLFLTLLNCSLLLALVLINCDTRLGPFLHLCLWIPRCNRLNWFATSLATLQPLSFGLLHHQIRSPLLFPIGRLIRVYQNSDWHWCCCSCHSQHGAGHFSPQSNPCWYYFLLPYSNRAVIPVSNVCELLTKVHYILDNAVFKWVGNSACILVHVFNFASRQCYEIWASQFPFFKVSRMWFLLVRLACMAI